MKKGAACTTRREDSWQGVQYLDAAAVRWNKRETAQSSITTADAGRPAPNIRRASTCAKARSVMRTAQAVGLLGLWIGQ